MEDFITIRHLENMAKVTLVTGLIVGYGYVSEASSAGTAPTSTKAS
jgi:molybdopterin-containing oxidoreductase family membrane subunit